MAEHFVFPGPTRLDIPAERVLNAALELDMKGVLVIGYDADGGEYFASSISSSAENVWLLERCKRALLRNADQ